MQLEKEKIKVIMIIKNKAEHSEKGKKSNPPVIPDQT
jgi:hypothetical protein